MGQKRSACRNWVEESKEGNHAESAGVEESIIECVPLATDPGIENIATKCELECVRCVRNEEECDCSVYVCVCVSVLRLIVATRSSGPPASGKIIKEMPGSVASGTPYM
jgi:hypothetical protein